ncbi:MAG: reverse transcriptase family protein [Sedimenticola sp.]
MKEKRIIWINNGQPRDTQSLVYSDYKESKRTFRKELRLRANAHKRLEYERIDKMCELDQNQFWKFVKSKRTNKRCNPGNEMCFDSSTIVTDSQVIASGWCHYFNELYSPTIDDNFSVQNKQFVENKVKDILQRDNATANCDNCEITYDLLPDELHNLLKSLPLGKSASSDSVTYEHLIYGGHRLQQCLHSLFQQLLIQERVPDSFKDGLIVTLHKGHGKPLTDPNSYRAISLTPVISKLYEKLLLSRLERKNYTNKLHPLQHGFQKNKSCKMVSFILQECIDYCRERGSELFTCFLDAEKAFDRVWIDGLLCKLFDFGVRGKDLRTIATMYNNMRSKVLCQGVLSDWVHVQQGTRQGAITSPFLYAVYVNDLLQQLDDSHLGLSVGDRSFSAPTQADDIALLALSKHSIDGMLEICRNYSSLWRFRYNPVKSAIIVFGESRHKFANHARQWKYGSTTISEVTEYKHLGIVQSKYMVRPGNTDTVVQSARGTFLSLVNSGLHSDGLNPITALKLYQTIVLPRALFGCDLWNGISATNKRKLETVHHFCIKVIQSFPKQTRSDCALGMLGISSLESYMDAQKLNFYGMLCRCDNTYLVKYLFTHRLYQFLISSCSVQYGYIPDLFRVLQKYNLSDSIYKFSNNSQWLTKQCWNRKYKNYVATHEEMFWKTRLTSNPQFERFSNIQSALKPSNLWRAALTCPSSLSACTFVARLCTIRVVPDVHKICDKCWAICCDELYHLLSECSDPSVRSAVCVFWHNLRAKFGTQLYDYLSNMDTNSLIIHVLGGNEELVRDHMSSEDRTYFHLLAFCARSVCGFYST